MVRVPVVVVVVVVVVVQKILSLGTSTRITRAIIYTVKRAEKNVE